jgi:hypothetical protein
LGSIGRRRLKWRGRLPEKRDVSHGLAVIRFRVDSTEFRLREMLLLLTVQKVIKSEGISQEGQATAEKFKGNA